MKSSYLLFCSAALVIIFCTSSFDAWAAPSATTTTMTITSGGTPVTSVASGSVVTLTASVSSGSSHVTTGQVNFCDASATYCTDIHLVGTAQITKAGTARVAFRPGFGNHNYKAVFVGTKSAAASASAASALAVTGGSLTTAQIAQSGAPGDYTLTATVVGVGSVAPTGTVSFLNTSDGSAVVATAPMVAIPPAGSFLNAGIILSTWQTILSVAVGDFNGDGIADVVAGYYANSALMVLLGNGDGTFSSIGASPLTGSPYPEAIAVGDFDSDGNLDIAVANSPSFSVGNTVTILLGNGDGTFKPAMNANTGTYPASLVVGDFNGDGILDVAVANRDSNTVTILLGNGDGTFSPTVASPVTAAAPLSIVSGDYNGDGKLDLAVGGATLTVLLGNGDGTFTPAAASGQPAAGAEVIATGDFNEDGKLDLALLNGQTTITLLLGKGDGSFSSATVDTGLDPGFTNTIATLMAGDFNGDGHLDLVFFDYVTDDPGAIYGFSLLGHGTGTFTAPNPNTGFTELPALRPMAFAAGDMNGDGIPDLAVINDGSSASQVSTLFAANQLATGTATNLAVPPGSGANQVVASYSGDSNYRKSTSTPTTLNGALAITTVSIAASPNTVSVGGSVTFTATVSGNGVAATGTVTFSDNFGQLGTGTLNGSGVATYSTSALTIGSYSITAAYGGDSNYSASTSPAITLTVTSPPVSLTIAVPPVVAPGSNATATATFTAGSNYAGTINLTCILSNSPTGAQSLPRCSLNPASISLKAGGSGTSVLNVSTTAASSSASLARPSRKNLWGLGGGSVVFAALFMGFLPARRRWISLLAFLCLVVATSTIGCGGGGKGSTGPTTPATTAGSYTFTVSGVDSTNAAITTSATVVVVVQ
jgi:trimeric autotransporter adhesin